MTRDQDRLLMDGAAQARRGEEAGYRALLELTCVVHWRALGLLDVLPRAWMDYTGQAEDERWLDRVHSNDRERAEELRLRAISARRPWVSEHRLRRHDGVYRWTRVTAAPVLDAAGEVVEWFGACADVTDVTERIRGSEAQLRLVTEHTPIMLARCDANLRYEIVNASYAARFGLSAEQCVGMHIADLIGERAFEFIRPSIEAAMRGERVDGQGIVPYKNAPRWMRWSSGGSATRWGSSSSSSMSPGASRARSRSPPHAASRRSSGPPSPA